MKSPAFARRAALAAAPSTINDTGPLDEQSNGDLRRCGQGESFGFLGFEFRTLPFRCTKCQQTAARGGTKRKVGNRRILRVMVRDPATFRTQQQNAAKCFLFRLLTEGCWFDTICRSGATPLGSLDSALPCDFPCLAGVAPLSARL